MIVRKASKGKTYLPVAGIGQHRLPKESIRNVGEGMDKEYAPARTIKDTTNKAELSA